MDISLVAKMKKYDEFILYYNEGDERKVYKGKSLLFYSLSNNDIESRFLITNFLLSKGAEVNVTNEYGENLLHILLSRTNHNIKQTEELCKKLVDGGVNINQLDKKGRVPLQYLINMKYSDEELEPLYQIWFEQNSILVNYKNAWGKTPLEIAEQMPYRARLLERMKKYEWIDPPDKVTQYPHVHAYDNDGNLLDSLGNIVDRKSPDGHIRYKN